MKKLCIASMAALIFSGGYAVAQKDPAGNVKLTQAECQSVWGKADAAGSGSLSSMQAQAYVTNFKSIDTNADGKLSSAEFIAGCQKGLVHDSAGSGAGAGASGADSPESPPPAAPKKQY